MTILAIILIAIGVILMVVSSWVISYRMGYEQARKDEKATRDKINNAGGPAKDFYKMTRV